MLKAYKYRMYPNKEQKSLFAQHFGACRFVFNWALNNKICAYEEEQPLTRFELNRKIPELKEKYVWLNDVNSQSLQNATLNLDRAFTKFFREKNVGFPCFKSRKYPRQSFAVPQHYVVDFESNKIKLPKIGWVKTKLHRKFEGKCKTATVSMTPTRQFFISILVENDVVESKRQSFDKDTTVGIDLGITDFAVLSNGEKIGNPRFLNISLQRKQILQRRLSRKKKGSNNRQKAKQAVAKIEETICNQRHDFQHKLSFRLVCENQAIALENLNVTGMLKNSKLARHISDVAWSFFVTKLEYKARWQGKTIIRIGQFDPSSKICSKCGYYKKDMTLSDRDWVCPDCGAYHDRDINAAINIRKFTLDKQNLIGI